MKFIQGKLRNQWKMYCLDELFYSDNVCALLMSLQIAKTSLSLWADSGTSFMVCFSFLPPA
jgi:hypothetical protein